MEISKLQVYKYVTDEITIIYTDGTSDKINPINVGSINIEKDFDNDFFPILNLNISVNAAMYKKITGDKSVQFRLSIDKFAVKSTVDNVPTGVKYSEPVIREVFYVMSNETDNNQLTKLEEDISDTTNVDDDTNYNRALSLFLYCPHALDVNNVPDSYIFSNVDPMTTVVHLSSLFKVSKMLISSPDNVKKFPQIIIPGSKYKEMLQIVESIYGVYNKGSVQFYDFDKMYYISKDILNNQALTTGEPSMVNIQFTELGSGNDKLAGSYLDSNADRYFINSSSYPTISDVGSYTQEVAYNNLESVNTVNGHNNNAGVKLNGRNISNKRLIDNKYNNPYAINSALYSVKESNYIVTLNLVGIDLSHITPNKRYSLKFDFKDMANSMKYDGNYRVSKITHSLIKSSAEDYLDCDTAIILKKSI